MGFFEDLFDFNGNGTVDLDDDLMLMWITQNALKQEDKGDRAHAFSNLLLLAAEKEEADAEAAKKKMDAAKKLQQKIRALSHELYTIPIPCEVERKEELKETVKKYEDLKTQLAKITPEDDGSMLYYDCIELDQEIKRFICLAKENYRILNGERCELIYDPVAQKASELADLEREMEEWEEAEPEDCYSEAWDAWDSRRDEYECEIEEKREELEEEQLEARLRDQSYLSAYTEASKAVAESKIRVSKLEQLAQIVKKLGQEVERVTEEQRDALSSATWALEDEEPERLSPRWDSWHKCMDELKQFLERIDQIDPTW